MPPSSHRSRPSIAHSGAIDRCPLRPRLLHCYEAESLRIVTEKGSGMRIMLWSFGLLVLVVSVIWLGFQAPPEAFAAPPVTPGPVENAPQRAGLPAPVERFMRTVYGDDVPVYTSVVLTGHARIRRAGTWRLPARTRFIHETGSSYRH